MNLATETSSYYENLDSMPLAELLESINKEDQKVAFAVRQVIPQVEKFVHRLVENFQEGGRLFYIGAGTSGRLGILDASEIPPTFGASPELIVGLIAGGDSAIRSAVEGAEDDPNQAWLDLSAYKLKKYDTILGIAASGKTPYVLGGLKTAQENGLMTASLSCNSQSKISEFADFPIEVEVGPEFVTGSTRMKSGTAQKMVLNMISTSLMIRLGKVKGNKMVHMQLSNTKLIDRGVRMILSELPELTYSQAADLLKKHGSVYSVIEQFQ
ncbi:N-acetylmuramic acid 6-phosphate etherase [Algoriphagus aestuarii]|nr:N-acetylmuramic acid 6-phosphate etherase [Algoriphagus aestuarii]